ncbi:gephyrin-like molybdotransferase Glp [Lutimaribacter marinistellae]|uniref:Molybdopterin molybdenumtransferase n=1 Tax=Lutimaribacter marinistellae TaxID=1820329 RepID=A0ABV7TIH6_9RHOB
MTFLHDVLKPGCSCDAPEHPGKLISIDEALHRIGALCHPIAEVERLSLSQAHGRVLALPVVNDTPAPAFDNSAMDGYAVDARAFVGDGPWILQVSDRIPAGSGGQAALQPGTAARIFTGAPVPAGATAVVMQEQVRNAGALVRIDRRPSDGQNIRRIGSDMQAGEVVLTAGTILGPREIAAAAAAGAAEVTVRRRLRVALLVTGDEVRQAGTGRATAQIWDVNTPMLGAAIASPAMELVAAEPAADDRLRLRRQLADLCSRADLVVTTGGVSVGEEDHVKQALADLGGELALSGVAIKPGKPVSLGSVGSVTWLGLPGNPLAAFVTWQLFGETVVQHLTGQTRLRNQRRHVVTAFPIKRKPGRCEFRPANRIGFDALGRELVGFDGTTNSARVGNLPAADGLILLPADADDLPEGALVEFMPFFET